MASRVSNYGYYRRRHQADTVDADDRLELESDEMEEELS